MNRNDERVVLTHSRLYADLKSLCQRSAVGVVCRLCMLSLLAMCVLLSPWWDLLSSTGRLVRMILVGAFFLWRFIMICLLLVRVIASARLLRKDAFTVEEDVIVKKEAMTLLPSSRKSGFRSRAAKTRYTFERNGTITVRTCEYSLLAVGKRCYLVCCVGKDRFPLLGNRKILFVFSEDAYRPTDEDHLRFLSEAATKEKEVTRKDA